MQGQITRHASGRPEFSRLMAATAPDGLARALETLSLRLPHRTTEQTARAVAFRWHVRDGEWDGVTPAAETEDLAGALLELDLATDSTCMAVAESVYRLMHAAEVRS